MESSKIGGHDLAIKIWHHYKHNITLNAVHQWHLHVGPFTRVEYFNEGVSLDFSLLFLENPDQPMRSYEHEIKQMHRIDMSEGTINQCFRQHKRCKGALFVD